MLFAAQVGDLFEGGRSSCEGYTEIFATLSRVELLVAKNTQKFFSKVFFLVFWRLALTTCMQLDSVAKIACFAQIRQFLKHFSFSLELTVSLSNEPPFLHHFNLKSSRKKVWVFITFHVYSMCFLDFCVICFSCVEWVYSIGLAKGVLLILMI